MSPTTWTELVAPDPDFIEIDANQSNSGNLVDFIFGCFAWEQPDIQGNVNDYTELSVAAASYTELSVTAATWTEVTA